MTDAQLIILFLGILNVFQFIFHSWNNHMLVNKLMSRDFTDYKLNMKKPEKEIIRLNEEIGSEAEEMDILAELNGMLPSTKHDV